MVSVRFISLIGLVYQTEFSRSVKHIWFSFPILPVGVYRYLQHNTKSRKSKALSAQNSHENFFRLWHTLYGEGKGDGVLRAVIFQQPRQLLCVIERNAVRKCLLLGGWQRACVDACAQDRAIALTDDKPVIFALHRIANCCARRNGRRGTGSARPAAQC